MKNPEKENKETEQLKTANKNKNLQKLFMNQYLDIKKNILELYLENEELLSKEKQKKRNISQPKSKYIRFHLKKKHENNKCDKKVSQNQIDKNKPDNIIKDQEIKETNNKININKVDINNKEQNINQNNSNINKGYEVIKNSGILNKIINSSSDIYKFFVNDIPGIKNNSSQNINGIKVEENNSDINLYNIGDNNNNQEGNFSDKSSKNGSNNANSNLDNSVREIEDALIFDKNTLEKLKRQQIEFCKNNNNQNNFIKEYEEQITLTKVCLLSQLFDMYVYKNNDLISTEIINTQS